MRAARADEYVIFEDWLWMMAKQEEGGGVFVGSRKAFGTLSNIGARLRHHEKTLSDWFLVFSPYQKVDDKSENKKKKKKSLDSEREASFGFPCTRALPQN